MCGRYSLVSAADKLASRFNVDVTEGYTPRYNAAPTQLLPIITNEHPQGFSFFYWGLIPQWSKNKAVSNKLFNARAETLDAKASFKNALKRRRCLVPADGFYEWKTYTKKRKVPYRFMLDKGQPFAFAGLWEEFQDEKDNPVHTFTIITTAPNPLVADVHDRMPVILTPETEKSWLNDSLKTEEHLALLTTYPAGLMTKYSVSPQVNNVANDSPALIKPAPAADQFGNYTLFN